MMMSSLEDELRREHFRVVIFGSARIQEDDPWYKLVYNLSKLIASAGWDVVTGGGPGLMDAASKGHHSGRKDSSLHSIGLNIKLPLEQIEAYHLDVKTEFANFSSRLDHFMILSNAVVITPGGVGTLLEFFYTWQLMQVKHICSVPIVLLGEMWLDLAEWIKRWPLQKTFLSSGDFDLLYVTRNCDEAFEVIQKAYEDRRKGGERFCYNYHKYKIK
jgi:uncharacterized protein (TIGR00730 family)